MGDDDGMPGGPDIEHHLKTWAGADAARSEVAAVVAALGRAGVAIAQLLREGPLAGRLGAATGRRSRIDEQKNLDVIADGVIVEALRRAPVAALLSEEAEAPHLLDAAARLLVAVDPIDGSSNIDAGTTIGTIFSVLPAPGPIGAAADLAAAFLQPGTRQLAAGFFIYGPFTALALTVGQGTHIFTLDPASGRLLLTAMDVQIPAETREFALNVSNSRHWDVVVQTYLEDCLRGSEGPRAKDFNMRWTASPVADVFRILTRGGVFLYPGDRRDGYGKGRLRLIYEANPLALIVEQAGGAATSGTSRMLAIKPEEPHEHTPIILGSRDEVAYLVRLALSPHAMSERHPLFVRRGLFR